MAVTKTEKTTSKAILPVKESSIIAAAKADKKPAAPAKKVEAVKAPSKAILPIKESNIIAEAKADKKPAAPAVKATPAKAVAAASKVAAAPVAKTEVKAVSKAEVKAPAKAEVKTTVKTAAPKKEKGVKKAAPYSSNGQVRVELVHSTASCTKKQIRTVQALGLKKLNDVHIHKDNPAIQGMIRIVAHLVKVEKVS